MTKKDMKELKKHMLNMLDSVRKNRVLAADNQSKIFWSAQIIAYQNILKELLKISLSKQEKEILNNII